MEIWKKENIAKAFGVSIEEVFTVVEDTNNQNIWR